MVRMRQGYCFTCGCYTWIDTVTKLCKGCYQRWPTRAHPQR